MLTYDFTNRKNQPLYEFLYTSFKKDILNSRLIQGSKLPSKRSFAKDNQISVRTVMNAYEQLWAEGFILSEEKKVILWLRFMRMKSAWSLEPAWKIRTIRELYVRRDDRIKAHFMTCYISLLFYRLLEKKNRECLYRKSDSGNTTFHADNTVEYSKRIYSVLYKNRINGCITQNIWFQNGL